MTTAPNAGPMQMPATWDAVSAGYAEENVARMMPWTEEAIRLGAPAPNARVLDLACGPGTLAFLVAPRVASVAAVDFSSGMIDEVKRRVAREHVTNVEPALMDASSLAFPDASFDVVFCLFGFMFFPDRARAFAETRRVLREGGRSVVATWGPIEKRPMMKIGFDALAEALPDLPRPAKGDLQSIEEAEREMSAAGFRDVVATTFTATLRVDSADQYVRSMERSGAPFAALKKRLGEEAWAAAHERLLEGVTRRLAEGPADLAAEAIMTCGIR